MHSHKSPFRMLALAATLGFAASAAASSATPRIVSSDFEEVSFHLFNERDINNQSGERVVIEALLFDAAASSANQGGDTTLVQEDFSLVIPSGKVGSRLCVDLGSRTASFRRMSVVRLTKAVEKVSAHLELAQASDMVSGGAVMVAYSTDDESKNPLEACLLQKNWIFPARHKSLDDPRAKPVLQMRLNSGNGTTSVVQVDAAGTAIGMSTSCTREEGSSGLFDRLCRLDLRPTGGSVARVKVKIRQRNGLPAERTFDIALGGASL